MTRPQRRRRKLASILAALVLLPSLARALDVTQWKSRQAIVIAHPGAVRLTLPPETLDAARAGLEDLRLLDSNGRETPYLLAYATATAGALTAPPKGFTVALNESATEIVIETGTTELLDAVSLTSPSPAFLKPSRVEVSTDGRSWTLISEGVPIFRQFGAEQMRLDLHQQSVARVRVTIDDTHSKPIPITGATLRLTSKIQPAPTEPLASARLVRREEFAGESVLTVDLGARHVPLAQLAFAASDPVFTRKVSVLMRVLQDETAVEQTLATGTIYRLAIDGLEPTAQLEVPLHVTASSRELIVRISNGDSPPLAIDHLTLQQHPVSLVFHAETAGAYLLLTGNRTATAPRYDLSGFSARLKGSPPSGVQVGSLEPNPAYHPTDALAETVLTGAPVDVTSWRFHKPVLLAEGRVHQLELDADVLAGTANGGGDVRLVRDGKQIPYIIERPSLSRALRVNLVSVAPQAAPRQSRWEIKLPQDGLPLTRLTLRCSTPLFDRHIRVLEAITDVRSEPYDRLLAEAHWRRTDQGSDTLLLPLQGPVAGGRLIIETDNADNPSIALSSAEVAYPVVRLLFKADPGPLSLYYGNPEATTPRYDVALIADQLVAADKSIARLGEGEASRGQKWSEVIGTRAGLLFWGALALVVIVLLVLVAKLLPKAP